MQNTVRDFILGIALGVTIGISLVLGKSNGSSPEVYADENVHITKLPE